METRWRWEFIIKRCNIQNFEWRNSGNDKESLFTENILWNKYVERISLVYLTHWTDTGDESEKWRFASFKSMLRDSSIGVLKISVPKPFGFLWLDIWLCFLHIFHSKSVGKCDQSDFQLSLRGTGWHGSHESKRIPTSVMKRFIPRFVALRCCFFLFYISAEFRWQVSVRCDVFAFVSLDRLTRILSVWLLKNAARSDTLMKLHLPCPAATKVNMKSISADSTSTSSNQPRPLPHFLRHESFHFPAILKDSSPLTPTPFQLKS